MNLTESGRESARQEAFLRDSERILARVEAFGDCADCTALREAISGFREKAARFSGEEKTLNIGVIGQVKAGKSSFLNNLLFEGRPVLPAAKTPKTAVLTSIEYAESNELLIEYYTPDEWSTLQACAENEFGGSEAEAAREIMKMVRESGEEPMRYLSRGEERIAFASADDIMERLNGFVGENGAHTPFVKNVVIRMDREDLRDIRVVDTPGMNDAIVSRVEKTRQFLSRCDVVFFLSRASQFLTGVDADLLAAQLPQKGVGELILIASRFDEGLMDELRRIKDLEQTIVSVREKLTAQAERIMQGQAEQAKRSVSDPELRASRERMLLSCRVPLFMAALPDAMSRKEPAAYDRTEQHIFNRLGKFGGLDAQMLRRIGNLDEVRGRFAEIVRRKDAYLARQMAGLLPQAEENRLSALRNLRQETVRRKTLLETGDHAELQRQSRSMQQQIHGIRADIAAVTGELSARLSATRQETLRALREARSRYATVQTREGSETHRETVTEYAFELGPIKIGPRERDRFYTETYRYIAAADAVENIRNYANEACSEIEAAFYRAADPRAAKRQMIRVVQENMDTSDETFDVNHFRLLAEKTVGRLEFPVMQLDASPFVAAISGRFSGRLRDTSEQDELQETLSRTVSDLLEHLTDRFMALSSAFGTAIARIEENFESELLKSIREEYETLQRQCDDKEHELARYAELLAVLDGELKNETR